MRWGDFAIGELRVAGAVGVEAALDIALTGAKVEAGTLAIADFCLSRTAARVCGAIQYSGTSADRIEVAVSRFPLQSLASLLPEALSVDGVYDATLEVAGAMDNPSASFTVRGGTTRAALQMGSSELATEFDALAVAGTLAGGRLDFEGSAESSRHGRFGLAVGVEDVRKADPSAAMPRITEATISGTTTNWMASRNSLRAGTPSCPRVPPNRWKPDRRSAPEGRRSPRRDRSPPGPAATGAGG